MLLLKGLQGAGLQGAGLFARCPEAYNYWGARHVFTVPQPLYEVRKGECSADHS